MEEDVKVSETPKVSDEVLIENVRATVENAVIKENDTPNVIEVDEEAEKPQVIKEAAEETPQISEVDRIKQAVQKRIDKVVAKQKSAEEQLAEAQAEIARLKSNSQHADTPSPKDGTAQPTIEQVEAYILKMREEGNAKEEIAATRYLIKLEKDSAIKAVQDEQTKLKQEAEAKVKRENDALLELAKDYVEYDGTGQVDMKSDLTLANQKGKLFQTTMALYNDPELRKLFYSDSDRPAALRRATADAFRELHQQGLIGKTPKVDVVDRRRQVLADPDSVSEEVPSQPNSNLLSDADKVREEIKNRNKLRNSRRVSQ